MCKANPLFAWFEKAQIEHWIVGLLGRRYITEHGFILPMRDVELNQTDAL